VSGNEIQIGDKFAKTEAPGTVWVVEYLISGEKGLPHVRLFQENRPKRKRTLSSAVLLDTSLHRRVASGD
jgi:hypothetical protein